MRITGLSFGAAAHRESRSDRFEGLEWLPARAAVEERPAEGGAEGAAHRDPRGVAKRAPNGGTVGGRRDPGFPEPGAAGAGPAMGRPRHLEGERDLDLPAEDAKGVRDGHLDHLEGRAG